MSFYYKPVSGVDDITFALNQCRTSKDGVDPESHDLGQMLHEPMLIQRHHLGSVLSGSGRI